MTLRKANILFWKVQAWLPLCWCLPAAVWHVSTGTLQSRDVLQLIVRTAGVNAEINHVLIIDSDVTHWADQIPSCCVHVRWNSLSFPFSWCVYKTGGTEKADFCSRRPLVAHIQKVTLVERAPSSELFTLHHCFPFYHPSAIKRIFQRANDVCHHQLFPVN